MASFRARSYEREDLIPLVDFFRDLLRARAPGLSYLHPGAAVWEFYRPGQDVRLWEDDGGLAGFATFEPPLVWQFQVRAGISLAESPAGDMIEWAESQAMAVASQSRPVPVGYAMLGERTLSTEVLESDGERIALLEAAGYRRVERHSLRFRLDLGAPIQRAAPPPGMRLRHVTDDDFEERVAIHRDAWSVWGPSSFSIEAYRELRRQPIYDEQFDIVLEDAAGRFLSYCICWPDDATGTCVFEPVGTRPDFAGQSLARLVIGEALRRARARGLHTAWVATASINTRAARLYPACGFEMVERQYSYLKPLPLP